MRSLLKGENDGIKYILTLVGELYCSFTIIDLLDAFIVSLIVIIAIIISSIFLKSIGTIQFNL